MLNNLCGPAILFIGFSLIQILIDLYSNEFYKSFIKFIAMIVFSLILNILCNLNLHVIAWFIVFIPIIMMTLISTLLLKTFGINPDNELLQNEVKNPSRAQIEISNNLLATNEDLYTENVDTNRIDRDLIRENKYDDIYEDYDISYNESNKYDLSSNLEVYNFIDYLLNINSSNNTNWLNNVYNRLNLSKLFNNNSSLPVTSSDSLLMNSGLINNIGISELLDDYLLDNDYRDYNKNDYTVSVTNSDDLVSYEEKYSDDYKMQGKLLYNRVKYDDKERELKRYDPDVTRETIESELDKDWENLEADTQEIYNDRALDKNKSYYDANNFSSYARRTSILDDLYKNFKNNVPCPVNETPSSYKIKTGLTCYEICPPGKTRNKTTNKCE